MVEEASETSPSSYVPVLGSLIFTAGVVGLICKPPHRATLTWPQLLLISAAYVLLAAAAHAVAVWVVCKLLRDYIVTPWPVLMRGLWITAALLPLLALLAREHSVWMAFVLPLIAASTALAFRRWTSTEVRQVELVTGDRDAVPILLQIPEPPSFVRTILPAAFTSAAFQLGILLLLSSPFVAGLFFASGVITPVWIFPAKRKPCRRSPRSQSRSFTAQTLMIFLLIAMALLPSLRAGSFAADLAAKLIAVRVAPRLDHTFKDPSPPPGSYYSGIILFVPSKPSKNIVPPGPKRATQFNNAQRNPVVIPFDGPYWYFKHPDQRPRPGARVVRSDPTKVNIQSVDLWPLSMEAHQNLGTPIEKSCCSAIRVALRNADNRPGLISIELRLDNANIKGSLSESLGTLVIPSRKLCTSRHVPLLTE